jgi:two-component system NarL family sensor kinase
LSKYVHSIILFLFILLSLPDRVCGVNQVALELHRFDSLIGVNPIAAYNCLYQLNVLSRSKGVLPKQHVQILVAHSRWHNGQANCDSSLVYARKAWQVSPDRNSKAWACFALGASYRCIGKTDSSMYFFLFAEKQAKQTHDTTLLIRCLLNIGHLHSNLGNFAAAKNNYQQCHSLAQKKNDVEYIVRGMLSLASNLADRGVYIQASSMLKQALYQCKKYGLIRQQAMANNNLGMLYRQMSAYAESGRYFKQALRIHTLLGNKIDMAKENSNVGMVMHLNNNFKGAINMFHQAEALAHQLPDNPMLPEVYHNLAASYEQIGNYKKAYFYSEAERSLADSLRNLKMLKYTQQLQEEFEAEKRQLEITNLKQENDVKDLKHAARTKQRNVFMGLAAGLLCVALLVFFLLRQRVRNARQVNEKNIQIHQQQMDEVMRKSELQSIHTMLETQEKERKRIAEDLHDRVGSMLSTVRLQFSKFTPTAAPQQSGEFEKVAHLLDETCEEIRQVSHNLVSGVLSTFGLLPALNDLAQALRESSQLQINIQSHGIDTRMESDTEIHLYRMLQELFNNTIRHAQATEVNIDLSRFGNQLTLMYSDNGRGFDTTTLQHAGIGLKNMYSRVEKLNGSLHIDSGKGNGSTFIFTIQLT